MHEFIRVAFLAYFITHIPITLCIDLQGVFHEHYPVILKELYQWYLVEFNDVVMTSARPWLQSFLYAELLFQFPFFFVVIYGLIYRKNWIRIPSIAYGAHVSTTVLPIILEFAFSMQMTVHQKAVLLAIYSPYFIFPLSIMIYMCLVPTPFGDGKPRGKALWSFSGWITDCVK